MAAELQFVPLPTSQEPMLQHTTDLHQGPAINFLNLSNWQGGVGLLSPILQSPVRSLLQLAWVKFKSDLVFTCHWFWTLEIFFFVSGIQLRREKNPSTSFSFLSFGGSFEMKGMLLLKDNFDTHTSLLLFLRVYFLCLTRWSLVGSGIEVWRVALLLYLMVTISN